jgi:hypothetical protein
LLLQERLGKKEPRTHVCVILNWLKTVGQDWLVWFNNNVNENTVVIIDEGQTTYKNIGFWALLKQMDNSTKFRIIIFTSYGSGTSISPGSDSASGSDAASTPFPLDDRQQISLRPVEHPDGLPSAGLYLRKDEFTVYTFEKSYQQTFDEEILNMIFHIASGHVGAITEVLQIISAHEVRL